MSRRKQSNPKPLKLSGEDEEWRNENEAMTGEPRTPSSVGERASSSGGASPASMGSPAPVSASPTPPRLRLNTSLATDPALAPAAAPLKREASTPSPPPAPAAPHAPAAAPPSARDYLALSAAFPSLFSAAGVPPYVCVPCGIRYSSLSTLEAHRTYYCSHRRPKPAAEPADAATDATHDESSSDTPVKTPRGSKQYVCTHCSYSADRKVSLNRHMRMHSTSPSPPAAGVPAALTATHAPHTNGDAGAGETPPAQDRYCTDCDIRFSSTKTYRAHKTHYCSTRQIVKQLGTGSARGPSSGTSGSAPASPRATPPSPAAAQPVLALPTNPILILPYSLITGASVLPRAMLPDPDAPCFLLPNGTIQPINRALAAAGAPIDDKEPEVLKSANRPRDVARDGISSAPLDLSIRRSPDAPTPRARDDNEKENRLRSATPEQIVCAPSLPVSPVARTPSPRPRRSASPGTESSPKRRRRDSRDPTPKPIAASSPLEEKRVPHLSPALLAPHLALRLGGEGAPPAPQVLVKQGVSKCKECNIVFCKYENYLVHKRHYCSSGTSEELASPAPEPGPRPYRQLICFACGIRFNSLDNLATHQSYYCSKRETRSPRSVAAGASEAPRPASGGGPEGGWKCPCCDAVSATAAAAQRHMESHAGVKAFRCTICRYRGNTLRGMRTHIRMHFPKKPVDLQEETYIACVVEDDGRESTSPSTGHSTGASGGAETPAGGSATERVHRCGSCAYTSTYRGNIVRHARLVHGAEEPEPDEMPETSSAPPLAPPPLPAPAHTNPAPDIKREPDADDETPGPNYCKACDISFKYINTYKAHKQFYCLAHAHDPPNNNVPPAAAAAAPATLI